MRLSLIENPIPPLRRLNFDTSSLRPTYTSVIISFILQAKETVYSFHRGLISRVCKSYLTPINELLVISSIFISVSTDIFVMMTFSFLLRSRELIVIYVKYWEPCGYKLMVKIIANFL